MKKILIIACCLFGVFVSANAQVQIEQAERTPFLTKNGYKYLPVKGDFALGIEATPFLEYLGNAFNYTSNDAPNFLGYNNTIYFKYFRESDQAIRVKFRFNLLNTDNKNAVTLNDFDPLNPDATGIDIQTVKKTDLELRVGYEFRRGHGRVQGFYGGELMLGYGSGSAEYQYANPLTAANQIPTTTNFGVSPYTSASMTTAGRPTETILGNTLKAGLGAFAGVEYFFAPQISLGGELGFGVNYWNTTSGKTTTEMWDTNALEVIKRITRTYTNVNTAGNTVNGTPGANHFGLETKLGGAIFVIFHF